MKKLLSAIIIFGLNFILASCASNPYTLYDYQKSDIKLDLNSLEDENGVKYGVALFRSMFCYSNFPILTWYNGLIVSAAYPAKTSPTYYFKISSKHALYPRKSTTKILIDKLDDDNHLDSILKPEYFYGVTKLPEGKYYISYIAAEFAINRFFETRKSEGDMTYYFEIKAGEINYLGDFYWQRPTLKSRKWFANDEYKITTLVYNRSQEARKFINEFYPDNKLKFKTNMIKCCEPLVKNLNQHSN